MKFKGERFSEFREIAKALSGGAGPVLAYENKKVFSYDGEGHTMFLGVSGSGKSRRGTIPMTLSVLKKKESLVVVDPKGEIYENTKGAIGEEYDVHVVDFRNIYSSLKEGWNPLYAPYQLYKTGKPADRHMAEQMIEGLAYALYPVVKNQDPFWNSEARNVFLASAYTLFDCAQEDEINLASIYYIIAYGDMSSGGVTFLRQYVESNYASENSAMQLKSYVTTASDTRGGIRSCFLDGLSTCTKSESVRDFVSRNDLNINSLDGSKPTAIFIIIPDETIIYNDFAGVLVSQLSTHYVSVAQTKYKGRLPLRLNIIIEELGNIGKAIPNLPHLMTAGRSRNIRVAFVLQSMEQLEEIYGKHNAATIAANADCKVVFRVHSFETLSEFSKLCGDKTLYIDGSPVNTPLITPAQLSMMETGQALVLVSGLGLKFITFLPDFTEIFDVGREVRYKEKSFIRRDKVSVFDIRNYIKIKENEKRISGLLREK